MIAIRAHRSVVLGGLLATILGLVTWAAPAYAQEFSVTFECTASGADVTFVNEEDRLGLRVQYGSQSENYADGQFVFDPGESETISTTRPQLDYRVIEEQGDPSSEVGSIDLSSCADADDPGDDDDDDDDDDDAPRVAPDAGV